VYTGTVPSDPNDTRAQFLFERNFYFLFSISLDKTNYFPGVSFLKKLLIFALVFSLLITNAAAFSAQEEAVLDAADVPAGIFSEDDAAIDTDSLTISAPCAILIEKETGEVLYEKNADERNFPASVTKVMTILLAVEAVESGAVSLDDIVTVSATAAGMGGSQVFLEEGEQMSLHEMLKCIVVSSANDAAVAVAEFLSGSEETFVQRMNARAVELGMENTFFCNCTGLSDPEEHKTTARDIAIMSRELICHEWIKEFTTIWMDTIRDGEFGLSITNKLIYYYDGSTGLKTGYTQAAGYCLSATAMREGVEYIAAVMHCASSSDRFESAKTLLSYGFANYTLISATPDEALAPINVKLGKKSCIQPELDSVESILVSRQSAANVTKTIDIAEELTAPVRKGDEVGTLTLLDGDAVLKAVPIIAGDSVERLTVGDLFLKVLSAAFFGT